MAIEVQSIEEIRDEMLALKAGEPELAVFNSPSQTATWRLILYIIATKIHFLQQYLSRAASNLQAIANSAEAATGPWWQARMLEFQYSPTTPYPLVVDEASGAVRYETVDPTVRIITRVALQPNTGGGLFIKVARTDNGTLAKLSEEQVDAANAYVGQIEPFGTNALVQSFDPDKLRLEADIYVDGLFLTDNFRTLLTDAVTTFLGGLNFNAFLYVTALQDALQAVPGVRDVRLRVVQLVGSQLVNVSRVIRLPAGYAVLDPDQPPEEAFNLIVEN